MKKKSFNQPAGFWQRLHQLFFAYTLLTYGLTYWTPTGHWAAGFMMLSLPVIVIVHACFFVWFLSFNRSKIWLSAIALLLSFPFWARTYGSAYLQLKKTEVPSNESITIMNYNVMLFDVMHHLDKINPQNALDMVEWATTVEADIKCFQEFYNYDKGSDFRLLSQLKAVGYRHKALLIPANTPNEQNFFGMAIVSKFPMIAQGSQEFGDQNGLVWADIRLKTRTIRVVNVHFRSLVVRFNKLGAAYKNRDYQEGKAATKTVLAKLKYGFEQHAAEWEQVRKYVEESPYPVLVCGDFNETPYSYLYGKFRQKLSNAFEEAGHGFGFSYKNTPRFIRIDNQFFDPKAFQIQQFDTRRDIKFSDHYPVFGKYVLRYEL